MRRLELLQALAGIEEFAIPINLPIAIPFDRSANRKVGLIGR
jgi:hypothetical protein